MSKEKLDTALAALKGLVVDCYLEWDRRHRNDPYPP